MIPLPNKAAIALSICLGLILFAALLFGLNMSTSETKQIFEVTLNNKKIGQLRIKGSQKDNTNSYLLTSDIKIKFLIPVRVKEEISEIYKKNKLIKSTHYRKVNGSYEASNHLTLVKNHYRITDSLTGKTKKIIPSIKWSVLSIYFKEPKGIHQIYSHNYRKFMKINHQGNHVYYLQISKGKFTKFTYKRGKLILVESPSKFGTLRFTGQ